MTAKLVKPVFDLPPRRHARGAQTAAAVVSVGLHVAALIFFMSRRAESPPPSPPLPEVAAVVMMQPPPPKPTPDPASEEEPAPGPPSAAPASAKSAALKPAPRQAAKPPVRPPEVEPLPAPTSPKSTVPTPTAPVVVAAFPTVGEGDLTGATTAGAGDGGGGNGAGAGVCDMVRRVQNALRRDPDIRAAITNASRTSTASRALLVWNGSWVQSPGQEGKGLAGVRQAIAMEIAFAPDACRKQAMRGLVLMSMEDRPGGARVALGDGAWRWSDLLELAAVRR